MLRRILAILMLLSLISISVNVTYAAAEYLSIADYGAKGNGITDDTDAIQKAFDDGKEKGLPVYIPAGVYNYSKCLNIDSITVFGDGPEESVLRAIRYDYESIFLTGTSPKVYSLQVNGKGGESNMRNIDKCGCGFFVNQADGFEIANCYINNPSGIGIQAEFASGGKILYNKIYSTGADGMLICESSSGIEIAYNHTYRCGDDAIAVTSYGNKLCSDIEIHDNRCEENLYSRNIAVNGTDSVTVYRNYVSEGIAGISVTSTTQWNSSQNNNVKVYNNIIKNSNAYATNLYGAIHLRNDRGGTDTDIEIYDNLIYDYHRYGISLTGNSTIEANIYNNRFYADSGMGLLKNEGTVAGVTSTNNTLSSAANYPGDLFFSNAGLYDGYVKGLNLPMVGNSKVYKLGSLHVKDFEKNKLGPWGFYATAGYYPVKPITKGSGYYTGSEYLKASGIKYDAYKYGVVTDENYYIPLEPTWIANYENENPESNNYVVQGIYFSTDGFALPYGNKPQIIIPEKKDNGGYVKFWCDAPEITNKSVAGDVAISFTAPDDGYYDIYNCFENRGTGPTSSGKCMHRITVLQNGEITENAQNTTDTLFGEFSGGAMSEPLEFTKSVQLKRGDMVFIRVSAYNDGYNDKVFGRVIITQKDELGEPVRVYDLSDVGMSDTADFKFYYAEPEETDTQSYRRLHPTSDGALAAHTGRTPYTVGTPDDQYLSPAIRWDGKENELVTIKNGEQDSIISWTAPENGRYKVTLGAERLNYERAYGGDIRVSIVKNGSNIDDTNWFTLSIDDITQQTDGYETWLNKGDTIYFRAHSDVDNAKLRLQSSITIENTSNLLTARYFIGDTELTDVSQFIKDSAVTAKIDVKNTTKLPINAYAIIGVYDATGSLITYAASNKFTVLANRTKETTVDFTVPEHTGDITVKAFLWNDLETMQPVTGAEVLSK